MSKKRKNLWKQWEEEIKEFNNAVKLSLPDTTVRDWQRFLMFTFMQELSKNVLNENESLDSILDRIIEAIQIGCGFKRVRVYLVKEEDRDKKKLHLYKTSKGHMPIIKNFLLEMNDEKDDAVRTLIVEKKPLAVDDAAKLYLARILDLEIEGPYAAIPLLVENKPYGLICADTAFMPAEDTHKFSYPESKEYFHTFARAIMAAIENREIFEQRNRNIKQFKMVKVLNELIVAETDKERLLCSFMEYCVKSVNANGGHLKLFNKEKERLEAVAEYGMDVAPLNIIMSKPEKLSFSKIVFKSKKAILINDLTSHPLMIENIKYYKKEGYREYLEILKKRKSSLIVPLIKHTEEIYGVLSLHSRNKNQFTEIDKEILMALASSVTYALDKTQQLEKQNKLLKRQEEILDKREKFIKMLQIAVEKANDVKSVLKIIRDWCLDSRVVKGLINVCLWIRDPYTSELTPSFSKCPKLLLKNIDCHSCLEKNYIVKEALKGRVYKKGKNDLAFPISFKEEVIGVLYLEGSKKFILDDEEKKWMEIITKTAAILISTARDFGAKIKQTATLYEVGQLSTKTRDFKEWFNPVMGKVMDIVGRESRNFHLVKVEEKNDEQKLFVRATSPLFINGREFSTEPELLGAELPIDNSLSGLVIKTKESQIIHDIEENKKIKDNEPNKITFHDYDNKISCEVGIPLKIKEGNEEKVIGVLVIDSVKPNDFQDFDWKFYETVANYLAISIYNQQLYEERARFQEELSRIDRTTELSIFLKSFFHEIKNPLSELNSAINLIEMNVKDPSSQKYIDKAKEISHQMLSGYEEFVNSFAKPVNKRETIEVQKLLENSLQTVEKTSGLGIEPKYNYNGGEFRINCYPVYIELAFRSIINNAVKFSRGVNPKERYLEISVDSNDENNSVTTVFESSAIEKIPEDKLESIFKPFERIITREQGSGLGLALADLCVKMHNGDIKAENVREKNAVRFKITLPRGKLLERRVS